jgi:hypothetical protein
LLLNFASVYVLHVVAITGLYVGRQVRIVEIRFRTVHFGIVPRNVFRSVLITQSSFSIVKKAYVPLRTAWMKNGFSKPFSFPFHET